MTMQQFFNAFSYTIEDESSFLFVDILLFIQNIAETVVSTPLLLFTTGFLFLGGCIGIFGRLLSRN